MKKLIIFTITIVFLSLTFACAGKTSPIVGTWERIDTKAEGKQTFSANGDWVLKSDKITDKGRYEIKNGTLRIILIDEKTGKENPFDSKYKIIELTENSLILAEEIGVKETYKKINQ